MTEPLPVILVSAVPPRGDGNEDSGRIRLGGASDLHRFIDADRFAIRHQVVQGTDRAAAEALRHRLRGAAVVVNLITDPDIAPTALSVLEHATAGSTVPLLNRPAAVQRSRRDRAAAALAGVPGLVVPRTLRLPAAARSALPRKLRDLRWPLLLRPAKQHGGRALVKVDTPGEALAAEAMLPPGDLYATEFVDHTGPDGLCRKGRVFVIGGIPVPRHLIAAPGWNVHMRSRQEVMRDDQRLKAEEDAFVNHPAEAIGARRGKVLTLVAERLGLDFVGIDFAPLPNGRILLFEANPCMNVLPQPDITAFPHLRRVPGRIGIAVNRMLEGALAGGLKRAG